MTARHPVAREVFQCQLSAFLGADPLQALGELAAVKERFALLGQGFHGAGQLFLTEQCAFGQQIAVSCCEMGP